MNNYVFSQTGDGNTQIANMGNVRHARWAKVKYDYGHLYCGECTNCGCEPIQNPFHGPWRYCPNCGAMMDEKEADNG